MCDGGAAELSQQARNALIVAVFAELAVVGEHRWRIIGIAVTVGDGDRLPVLDQFDVLRGFTEDQESGGELAGVHH